MTWPTRWIAIAALALACHAHDAHISIRRSQPRTIAISSDSELRPDSPSTEGSFAQILLDDGTLTQIFFRIEKAGENAIDLVDLQCRDAARNLFPLNLFQGELEHCGVPPLTGTLQRTVFVRLAGFKTAGMSSAENILLETAIQLRAAPELFIREAEAGHKQISLAVPPADLPSIHDAIVANQSQVTVLLKPSAKDPLPPKTATVTKVEPATIPPNAAPRIVLTLSDPIPRRPDPVNVVVTVPRAALPPAIAARLQPGDPGLIGATRVDPISAEPWLNLDLTFTSAVSSKNRARLNAGIFKLGLNRDQTVHTFATPKTAGALLWRGYLDADISTLNQADFDTPTQIAAGTELELQLEGGATQAVRGVHFLGGYRHESDRDFKFQLALARLGVKPVLPFANQSRAYRSRKYKGHPITAIRLQPAFYYDFGDVVRDRPQRLIPNIERTDNISRTVASLDFRLEIKRFLALTAYDEYAHVFSLSRRPNRNYLNAGMEISTGYLFGATFLGGIQNAILLKFQRGEQGPVYKPVNAFSMGFKLTR